MKKQPTEKWGKNKKKKDLQNLICNCKKSPILIVDDNPFNLDALQIIISTKFGI